MLCGSWSVWCWWWASSWRLDSKLRPAILEIALSDLETVVNNTIDQVCIQDAADGEIAYSKLVQLQYDQNGKLQGLTTDMAALNVLPGGYDPCHRPGVGGGGGTAHPGAPGHCLGHHVVL